MLSSKTRHVKYKTDYQATVYQAYIQIGNFTVGFQVW